MMTKHKVAELEGALLDAAVAVAEGFPSFWIAPATDDQDESCVLGPARAQDARFDWTPSSAWEQGGPIIDRKHIGTSYEEVTGLWHAEVEHDARADGVQRTFASGPTALVAAMRAYVASKFGDDVELP